MENAMDLGFLLLRLVVGLTLAAHGAQKLFGWFGGYGLENTGRFLEQMGFVPGRRHALTAGLGETGAGLLLAAGLFTPIAGAIVFAVMLVAGITAHAKAGFFVTSGGYEYNVVLAAAAISLAFSGAGAWSLDALLGLPLSGPAWGALAIALGLAGSVVPLTARRTAITH
jgi:putative oxidoreductase